MKYETRSVGWWIRSKPWLAPNLTLWPSKFLFEIHNGRGNNGSLLLLPLCCGSSPLFSSPRLAVIYALRGTNSRWKDARTRCRHVHGNAHDRTLSFSAIFFSSRFFFVPVLKSLHFLSVAFFPSHFFFNRRTFISICFTQQPRFVSCVVHRSFFNLKSHQVQFILILLLSSLQFILELLLSFDHNQRLG